MSNNKHSVEKNYIYNLIYQILVVIVPIVITPYVSRVLHASGIGAFSYTTAVAGYFVLFGNLGIATYGQLQVAGLRNNKQELSRVFFELLFLRMALLCVILVSYVGFVHFGSRSYNKQLYYVLIVQILAGALDISWFLQGLEEFKKLVVRNILIKIFCVFLILAFVKQEEDLLLYALIMNGSTLLGNLSVYCLIPRFLKWVSLKDLNIFRHLRPCVVYFIPTIATAVYLTLDKTMIGWFTKTATENGYYEQAHKIEQMAVTVVTSLSVVTMPRMAFLYKNQEVDKLKQRLEKTIEFIMLIAIPGCLGILAIADSFVPLFLGIGYDKSTTLLKIFSVLLIVVGLNNAVGKQVLMAVERQHQYNLSVIVGAVINFALNLLLIPKLLSVGAAVASVVAEMVILLMFIYHAKDFVRLAWIVKKSMKYAISASVMFLVIRWSARYFSEGWLNLFLQIFVGIVVYGVFVVLLRDEFVLEGIRFMKSKMQDVIKRQDE